MSAETSEVKLPEAFFHEESGAVRFWVRTAGGGSMGAIARKEVLHFRFQEVASGVDALQTYLENQAEIHAAVLRRIAAGSLEPVILRESDFNAR